MKNQIDCAVSLLQRLHQEKLSAREIAEELNAAGYVTQRGEQFTRDNVLNILHRQSRGLPGRYAVAFARVERSACPAQ